MYYKPIGESEENLKAMKLMDNYHMEHPSCGVLGMQDMLRGEKIMANHKRVKRLMGVMDIHAIYPRRCLSRCDYAKYIYPYLLRDKKEYTRNEVWSIDISYIPMSKGFMYLTAIIDVATRFIVGWALSNSLEAKICTDVLDAAIMRYGKPGIINSDQGTQFTCPRWIEYVKGKGITVSMDSRGRAKDNIWIERFWRTIKQEYIYLNPTDDGLELYQGIKDYMVFYNFERSHQGIGRKIPAEIYLRNAA